MLAVWVLGGLISLCGALSVAELAASLPRTGGWYVYLREGWGRLAGFLFGWSELVLIRASATGAVATVFSEYLQRSLGYTPVPTRTNIIAAATIAFSAIVNIRGAQVGAALTTASTVAKFSALVCLTLLAFLLGGPDASFAHVTAFAAPVQPGLFGLAIISVLYAYDGFADLAFAAGEVKRPAAHAATRHHRRHARHHRDLSRGQPRLLVCQSDRAAGAVAADCGGHDAGDRRPLRGRLRLGRRHACPRSAR